MLSRRGFLKLTGAAAVAAAGSRLLLNSGIALYDEPIVALSSGAQIIDKDSYIQIVMTPGSVLRNHVFTKPVLLGGEGGRIENCIFNYFNLWGSWHEINECLFDARGMATVRERAVIVLMDDSHRNTFRGGRITAAHGNTAGIQCVTIDDPNHGKNLYIHR